GEQVQFDDRFFQPWNGQRVYAISDLPERFKWEFLKNPASNGATVKRLWKNIYTVGENELPKLLVSTNYSYTGKDGGLRRRIIPVEFTDYFKREGGVDEVYNKLFPADFDDEDWATFDNYILLSIKKFLASPKLKHPELTDTGWVKQFRQTYSRHIYDFISANIERFVNLGFVDSDFFTATYDNYCAAEGVGVKYRVSRQRMNDALQDYCDKHGIAFER